MFTRDKRKLTTSYLKDDNGKLWNEEIIVTLLDAVATVDILGASNNEVKLVETQTVNFA